MLVYAYPYVECKLSFSVERGAPSKAFVKVQGMAKAIPPSYSRPLEKLLFS